jgi:ribosomal protein S18 acetylase RimI-like enzyme
MMTAQAVAEASPCELRAMRPGDLDAVAALDARIGGRSRRGYFVRRLEAALGRPEQHIQLTAEDAAGAFLGFCLYRIEAGEFGAGARTAVLETIGVRPDLHGRGIGSALVAKARAILRSKGIRTETTRAEWRNHRLLAFLDRAGFELAPRQVISFDLRARRGPEPEVNVSALAAAGIQAEPHEADYGRPAFDAADAPARDRIPVRSMSAADAEAVLRIDRHAMGRERGCYIRTLMAEALDRAGVRVSLVAEIDGMPVGFVMARVEYGDFGRTEPAAIVDTIGVDPDFRRTGIASALLSQLVVNLGGLGIERIETEVAREQFDLLGLFYRWGFAPSQRVAFARALA